MIGITPKTAILAATAWLSAYGASPIEFNEGSRFPGIRLPALEEGGPQSAHEFHGKKLMLHLFASW